MKKLLLSLATLFIVGVASVSAKTLQATLGTPDGEGVWTADQNLYEWKKGWSNLMTLFTFTSGELKEYTALHLTTSDLTDGPYRVCFMNGSNAVATIAFYSAGQKDLVLSERSETASIDLSKITSIRFGGASGSGSVKLDPASVYLEGPDVSYIKAVPAGDLLTTTMFLAWDGVGADATSTGNGGCEIHFNEAKDPGTTMYGNGSVVQDQYANLSAYNKMTIFGASGSPVRAIFNTVGASDPKTYVEDVRNIGSEGFVVYDFKNDEKLKNLEFVHLNCIKNPWQGTPCTISKIVLTKISDENCYVLEGEVEGDASLTAALADADATLYDATGVTATGLELTPANPNAIFVAKAGVLSNAKNVSVDGTIANLVIADGKTFAAPASTTATAASYSREMANQFGTICLPFATASTETTKFYTINELKDDVLTLTEVENLPAGTPAIVEKVSGSSISATGAGALADAAKATADLDLTGTFKAQTINAANYAGKGIYAISNNEFVKANTSINLPAFRAFFTAAETASAKIRLSDDEDATAINALAGAGNVTVESIHAVNGAKLSSLQKGINVVKLSNGNVKKVLVK